MYPPPPPEAVSAAMKSLSSMGREATSADETPELEPARRVAAGSTGSGPSSWAVACTLIRHKPGNMDIALYLGEHTATSEDEATGKGVSTAMEKNKGFQLSMVAALEMAPNTRLGHTEK